MSEILFFKYRNNWCRLSGFVLLWLPVMAMAQVYKCETDAGNIIFSDVPCKKGEYSTRLNWLKSKPSGNKSKSTKAFISERAKKTARKAQRTNEAYVLLSLLTTTQLELETVSLRSSLGGEQSDAPELLLSDGITVDLLRVDKILIASSLGKNQLRVRFIMNDGYEEEKIITKPFPVISGEAKIGRFSKSLNDIKQIQFFNSEKLLKDKKLIAKKRKKTITKKVPISTADKKDVPVIELDLTHEIKGQNTTVPGKQSPKAKNDVTDSKFPLKKLTPNKNKPKSIQPSGHYVPVVFSNDKKTALRRSSLGSTKGSQKSSGQQFILNDREHIPFDTIKSIRVRPTGDKNKLVVAVALKSGEIKMENMSKPFTRIQGDTSAGPFNHSLLEIKSISFKR